MAQVAAEQAKNQVLQQIGLKMLGTTNAQPQMYLSLFA
jgi:flagellin-like hook-associated protein FlgL